MAAKKKQAPAEVIEVTEVYETTEQPDGVINEGAWRLFSREEDGTETHVLSLGPDGCLVRSGGTLTWTKAASSRFFPSK